MSDKLTVTVTPDYENLKCSDQTGYSLLSVGPFAETAGTAAFLRIDGHPSPLHGTVLHFEPKPFETLHFFSNVSLARFKPGAKSSVWRSHYMDTLATEDSSTEMFEEFPDHSRAEPSSQPTFREASNEELLADLRYYEGKYGLSSEEFYRRRQAGQFEDSFDTSCWAILFRQARKLGLV